MAGSSGMSARARAALLALLVSATAAAAEPPPTPRALPADVTAALVAESGGVYRDRRLAAYVQRIGLRLGAAAGQGSAPWRFTVLDSPEANAFALPGWRIFVTRGMLALAGDEAELAAVLGHEIGHAVVGDGRVAASPRARRAAEFGADRRGMLYLREAGYDPAAQADFLANLDACRRLQGRLSGAAPAPVRAGDHPALTDRLAAARRDASGFAGRGVRNREAYLANLDGLVWGDGPAQGFLSGRSFVHPELGFAFDAPAGYLLENRPDAVAASGPAGALLLMDSVPDPGESPEEYLVRNWARDIGRGVGTGRIEGLRRTSLGGLPAAQAEIALHAPGSARVAELTVVRLRDRFYRLTGLHLPGDAAGREALAEAAASFRPLSAAERARARPLRIRIHTIAPGDDVTALASAMPVGPGARAWFQVLNGLHPGDGLRVGEEIKLVVE